MAHLLHEYLQTKKRRKKGSTHVILEKRDKGYTVSKEDEWLNIENLLLNKTSSLLEKVTVFMFEMKKTTTFKVKTK